MPIPMNATCVECFFSKRIARVRALGTPEQATELSRILLRQYVESPEDMDSALLGGIADATISEYFNIDPDRMREEKTQSNQFVLQRLEDIRSRIQKAEDPLYAALQFAVLGNYLDFAALQGKVSFEDLDKMLDTARDMDLDRENYLRFRRDLETGTRFLYITDNAGEICFDRLLAEVVAQMYPQLEITFLVRGAPVANDATREDARVAGITFPVIDSGNAIGGTSISRLRPEAKEALETADVILAKGMGNTESLYGCGYNVYYAFLVKCQRFVEYFNAPLMKPMFIPDQN